MEMRRFVLGEGGRTIVVPAMKGSGEPIASKVFETVPDVPVTILAFESDEWFDDFSPWPSEMAGRRFGGRGEQVLNEIEKHAPKGSFIAGYSLGGLFALWSLYRSKTFAGAACCSGSLWYEGWDAFADSNSVPSCSSVYLSLGSKEPRSGRPPMSSIGDCYERQELRMRSDPGISGFISIREPGNHFTDPDGRLARGICWLLTNNY